MNLAGIWATAASAAAPGIRMLLWLRARRGKEIAHRLPERRGVGGLQRPPGPLLWLHAASVGETASILPVLASLATQSPSTTLLLTTGTVTSHRLLASRLPELQLRTQLIHRFAPLDVPAWVGRFLDHWRPNAAGIVESELWPNLIAACQARAIPLVLLNGRLSPRSFTRWRFFGDTSRPMLQAFTAIEAQSTADADRLRALGALSVSVPGNLKYAASPLPADQAELRRLRPIVATRPAWLAASTHPGEEALVFAAHRALAVRHPRLLTIVVPRHPERGAGLFADAAPVPVTRRSAGQDPPEGSGIWIADTIGELGLFYRLVGTAFVGRSLVPPGGGQNPLEGARLGCAIAVGPYTANFTDILDSLAAAGAVARVADADSLVAWVDRMLSDEDARAKVGRAGTTSAVRHGELPTRMAAILIALMRRAPEPSGRPC